MSANRFEGKRALVTGAAGRIGGATAARLAAEGAQLILADRPGQALDDIAKQLGAAAIGYDAADAGDSAGLVVEAARLAGGLDVVCNIGGIYEKAHTGAVSDADWQRLLQINLNSVFTISRTALPYLRESRGNICSTASLAALEGLAYATAYAVSKAGIVALTKSMAAEFAADGIRVNCICPGGVRSGMSTVAPPVGFDPDLALRRSRLKGLSDGLGEPEDVAAAFAFLTSPEARYISGVALLVDGAQNLL